MDRFTIKDIELLSGIKAHTLRIWEQRYNLIVPKRRESNHRFYDNEDLKHILRIAHLYNNGVKISRIAHYQKEELKKIATLGNGEGVKNVHYVNQLIEAAVDFDEERFEEIIETAITSTGFENCLFNIVYPYFEKVGILWLSESVVPAQEHFSSNLIRRKIITEIDKLPNIIHQKNELLLLFTPEGEYHEIPLLLNQYLLKKYQRRTIYAGSNVPLEVLKEICEHKPVTHLYCYSITNFTKMSMEQYIVALARQFVNSSVVLAGPLTLQVTVFPANLVLLQSLQEQWHFAENKFTGK